MADFEHLIGYGSFYDTVSHIMIGGSIELYADPEKAIWRVTSPVDPLRTERVVFRRPPVVSSMHILISVMREVAGVVDLGHAILSDPELAMCTACSGVGFNEDEDGNQITCRECQGEGWLE